LTISEPATTASASRFSSLANFTATLAASKDTFFNMPSLYSITANILFAMFIPI